MTRYKPHYACFNCRKTYKRRLLIDVSRSNEFEEKAKCPQCSQLMANMGLDFESPKMKDIKKWDNIESLYKVGITFHSCGCTGPGYIPKSKIKLIEYLEEILSEYEANLDFWRKRIEPKNKSEIDRDNSKNWTYFYDIPKELKKKNKAIKNEDAKQYWLGKIIDISKKINLIKTEN